MHASRYSSGNLAQNAPSLVGRDLVKEVTCSAAYEWTQGQWDLGRGYRESSTFQVPGSKTLNPELRIPNFFVVAYDFGVKFNILRNLVEAGCRVRVVPAQTSAQ